MAFIQLAALAEQQRQLLSTLTPAIITIDDLKRLKDLYFQQFSDIRTIIKSHEELLEADCRPTLDKAQEVLRRFQGDKLTVKVSVRKSFEAIYTIEITDPVRESDREDVKKRKAKQHQRAHKIQELGCYGAMVLAGTLTTSEWSYAMTTPRFNYILEHLPKPPQKCPPALLQILDGWGKEPPLTNCTTFINSLAALHAVPTELCRDIQYALSNAQFAKVPLVVDLLLEAMVQSRQWKSERNEEDPRTSCVTVFIPIDEKQDGSVNFVVGRNAGFGVGEHLGMNPVL